MPLKPISDDLIEQVARIIDGYAFDARYRLKRQSRQQNAIKKATDTVNDKYKDDMQKARTDGDFQKLGDLRKAQSADLDKALAECDEAIWLDRQLPAAYLYRGEVFADKGEPDKAIADCTRAVQFEEHLSEAYRIRADAERFKSDAAAALTDYERALAELPPEAHDAAGQLRERIAALRKKP